MKIGKIEVTVPMLAYVAGFVVALVVLITMWKKSSSLRYESFCRNTIQRAMFDDAAAGTGIEYCQNLIAAYPDKPNARLFLGNLFFRSKRYSEAQKAFEEAAELPKATPREKAWAYTGAGVALFAAAPKDAVKSATAAETYFKKALDADKNCVDAIVNLGLAQLHKGGPDALDAAEKYCNQALEMQTPGDGKEDSVIAPSIRSLEQLYVLKGLVSGKKGQASEGVVYFDRAKALRLGATSEVNQRMAMLAALTEKNAEAAKRKTNLAKVEKELSKYGKDMISAYNALGVGYSMLTSEPDYVTGPLASAARSLSKAMESDPKDLRAYYNMGGIYEERLKELTKKISVPVNGFTGETPAVNPWIGGERPQLFTQADRTFVTDSKKVLNDLEAHWKKFLDKAKIEKPEKVDGKMRQLAAARRQIYLLEADEEGVRQNHLNRAGVLAKELENLDPDNAQVRAAIGYYLIDKGDYQGAQKEFLKALEKGYKSPQLEALMKGLNLKPEIADIRPGEGRRFYGPRPLIGGTLKAVTANGPPKGAVMKIDDKPVQAVLGGALGLQVLYYPTDKDLVDGDHTVAMTMTDSMGQDIEFPPFKFSLDKQPPRISITPDLSAPLPAKPVFAVTLDDRSGVDFTTLKVVMRYTASKAQPMLLIDGGRVKRTMQDTTPPRKIGFPIDNETFQFTAGADLQPGEYELTINVSDLAGNTVNEVKKFSVK